MEQARFMNNVQTRVQFPGRLFILAGQDQEREARCLKHFAEAFGDGDTGSRF